MYTEVSFEEMEEEAGDRAMAVFEMVPGTTSRIPDRESPAGKVWDDAWDALRGMVDSRLSLAQMVAGIREVTTTARDRAAAAAAAAAAAVAGEAARTALVLAVTAVAAATVVAAEEEMQQTAGGLEKAGADGAAGSFDSPAIRPPPYCTEFGNGDFWRRGHAHST